MMRVAPVSFRPGPIIGPELEARATPDTQTGTVAKTMLATHLEVIAVGHKLMPELTVQDLSLIADAVNGLWIGDEHGSAAGGWQTMWAEVADHIRLNQAAEHHGVTDPDGLVRRLQGMDSACKVALADAMRRFWLRDRQDGESVIDQFRAVGLAPHGA